MGLVLASALLGCKRQSDQVYYAPKDQTTTESAAPSAGETPQLNMTAPPSLPALTWTLPKDWQEKPASEMRVASFSVPGKDGQSADVSVIPLQNLDGLVLQNVNRWRGQVGLSPITEAELPGVTEKIDVAGSPASLFDQAGTAGDGSKTRILVAMLDRDGMTWFFKMMGDDALVAGQKPAFEDFLKSVKFSATSTALPSGHPAIGNDMSSAAASAPVENAGKPVWTVPSDWRELPPAQFLLAEYAVTGANGAAADVNVAMLNGEGGGVFANVNRWRAQLGLPPATEENLATVTSPLDVGVSKATVVDLTGTDSKTGQKARLVGVILPQAGQTWFYKLMGDEQLVEQQKAAFLQFVQSAKYSNAH